MGPYSAGRQFGVIFGAALNKVQCQTKHHKSQTRKKAESGPVCKGQAE